MPDSPKRPSVSPTDSPAGTNENDDSTTDPVQHLPPVHQPPPRSPSKAFPPLRWALPSFSYGQPSLLPPSLPIDTPTRSAPVRTLAEASAPGWKAIDNIPCHPRRSPSDHHHHHPESDPAPAGPRRRARGGCGTGAGRMGVAEGGWGGGRSSVLPDISTTTTRRRASDLSRPPTPIGEGEEPPSPGRTPRPAWGSVGGKCREEEKKDK
ncbi:hypothetical protein Hte_006297 [Hypoxylon texense]